MEIIKIAVLITVAVILSNGIPLLSKEITAFVTFSCCIVVILYTLKVVVPAVEYIKNIAQSISFKGFDIVLKAVGIGLITQFVYDTAIDCNNKTLANQMVLAGRVSILIIAIPLFEEIFKIIEQLTNTL